MKKLLWLVGSVISMVGGVLLSFFAFALGMGQQINGPITWFLIIIGIMISIGGLLAIFKFSIRREH